jgi:hypothetical protein
LEFHVTKGVTIMSKITRLKGPVINSRMTRPELEAIEIENRKGAEYYFDEIANEMSGGLPEDYKDVSSEIECLANDLRWHLERWQAAVDALIEQDNEAAEEAEEAKVAEPA